MRLRNLSLVVVPWCAGCVTTTAVLNEPLSSGRGYSYAAPAESLAAPATRAFAARHLELARDTMVGSARLLLGTEGITPMSWGEIHRVAITPSPAGADVRIISRSVRALNPWHQDRSPRLFQEVDRSLRGAGLRPFVGDRVRVVLRGPPHRTGTGVVLRPAAGGSSLILDIEGEVLVIPGEDLTRLAVSRGMYGHPQEGAIVGLLIGGITGFILAAPGSSSQFSGIAKAAGGLYGSVLGAIAGGLAGQAIRTEVWSDISLKPLGPLPQPVASPGPAHAGPRMAE